MGIAEIRERNVASGGHFFSEGALRFFNSQVLPKVYSGSGGTYFVTSEQFDANAGRRFTVRRALSDGTIERASEFQEFRYSEDALARARELSNGKA